MNIKKKKKRRKGFWNYVSVESPLDERQELISTKIQVEGISIALALIAVNTAVMDYFYKWCENYFMTVVFLVVISGIYMTVRRGAKGCLFGVKGARSEILTILGAGLTFPLLLMDDIESARLNMFEITRNGMVTQQFCLLIFWGLEFVEAMVLLFFIIREKRVKKRRTENPDKEDKKTAGKLMRRGANFLYVAFTFFNGTLTELQQMWCRFLTNVEIYVTI